MLCKKFKVILSISLVLVMLFSLSYVNIGVLKDVNASQTSQKQELEEKSSDLSKKLEQAKKETSDAAAVKQAYQEKIDVVQQEINYINSQINNLDNQISQKNYQINELNAKVNDSVQKLKQRICAIYTAGETSTLDILINATDVSDFLDKATLLQAVSVHDKKLIDDIKASIEEIEQDKQELDTQQEQMMSSKIELDGKKSELSSLLNESGIVLQNKQNEQLQISKSLDKTTSELESLNKQIEAAYQAQKKSDKSDGGVTPSPSSKHGYLWPTPGFTYISSPYGEQRDGYYHKGVDIAGSGINGTPILAAKTGTVSTSWYCNGGWGGGYGTYCMIDHDAGYSTLYAHMSRIAVSPGQHVEQGQVIGYVGTTGGSTGPHLHFECRHFGSTYDPMSEF